MSKKIWFGTPDYMRWVPAPSVGMGATATGWSNRMDFLDGGASVRRSNTSARNFDMAWNLQKQDDILPILDFARGVYGDKGIYWSDPFNFGRNSLPSVWATPYLSAQGGQNLAGVNAAKPSLIATSANTFGLPVRSAVYTLVAGTTNTAQAWVPVPPGYTAWIGWRGTKTGTASVGFGFTSQGNSRATLTAVSPTTVTAAGHGLTAILTQIEGDAADPSQTGVAVGLIGVGVVQVTTITVTLIPNGQVPHFEGYVAGSGHSQLAFEAEPMLTNYNAAMDRVGVSARLVEVGQWL